jgi:hypothetical protein
VPDAVAGEQERGRKKRLVTSASAGCPARSSTRSCMRTCSISNFAQLVAHPPKGSSLKGWLGLGGDA